MAEGAKATPGGKLPPLGGGAVVSLGLKANNQAALRLRPSAGYQQQAIPTFEIGTFLGLFWEIKLFTGYQMIWTPNRVPSLPHAFGRGVGVCPEFPMAVKH